MKFIISPRISSNLTQNEHELLEKDMQMLGEFVKGTDTDIYVVGGVALGLTEGKFYRNPSDFDIAVFYNDLGNFCDHVESKGYGFVRKIGHTHISPKYDLGIFSEIDSDQIKENNSHRYQRILRKKSSPIQKIDGRADLLDFYLLQDQGDKIYLMEYDISVPKEKFFPIQKHSLDNGTGLLVPNLEYRSYL
ncbi:MAG: hypothetical protein GTN38_02305 [Candidatus Aenigmarchaeota archaeon]|nr:hypothetical protein [Candidatus Aenigmarchaeota archaeon]NIP40385.1 hypothetical protein [Candidatus Aenigmarchaeota archaeon]NIQ18311.1 hypothetical protein [Candidatus Aenigmarchaeota archaeon]NIS73263.1 hypothetical protein [Candidatus Aenigmarchaeota archaeon]